MHSSLQCLTKSSIVILVLVSALTNHWANVDTSKLQHIGIEYEDLVDLMSFLVTATTFVAASS